MSAMAEAVSDDRVIAKRNLIKIKRVPDILVFVLISPIMFVLLFAYVFGGGDRRPGQGVDYKEFLVPGHLRPDRGVRRDVHRLRPGRRHAEGHHRPVPVAADVASAVLVGRTTSDVVYNIISLVIMALTGLLVGWRIREGVVDALVGFLLLLVFAYAISWIMAYVGLLVPSVEVVNNASFIVIFPLTFISNTFVPHEYPSGTR